MKTTEAERGGSLCPSVGRPWGFGKIRREGPDARCYNLGVREGNDTYPSEQLSWWGSNGLGESGRQEGETPAAGAGQAR